MRTSQYPLSTLKETPADAEIVSHQLMLRTGMIRKIAAGIYTWLPLGLRILRKAERIVREEMDNSGALEVMMPSIQPAELWQESKRWQQYGPELLRMQDRHGRDFCYGPTHEEVITEFARDDLKSYKQLPVNYYQIQTKFRDEIRPRFGVMRAREFLMKDAYSFHLDADSLQQTYELMHQTYSNIFTRLGLKFRAVQADSGNIGGSLSHEFHVLADSGEDAIAFSDQGEYAANTEMAEALTPKAARPAPGDAMHKVATPNAKTIDELVSQFDQPIGKTVKTLIVLASEESDTDLVALLVRGDHDLNPIKAEKLPQVASPLIMATEEQIRAATGAGPGSLGPVGLSIPLVVDRTVAVMSDFSAGANEDGWHYFNINWGRDLVEPQIADLRSVVDGDPSPDGSGTLSIARGIEVGHIFQLGDKYSQTMNATVLNESGRSVNMRMGCYGIGVSRVVAAAIEQNHDDKGVIWPVALAPFQVGIVPVNMHKSERAREAAEALHDELTKRGIEVLLDDRPVRIGVSLADMELIGIPHRVVIGERGLDNGVVEYRGRTDSENRDIPLDDIASFMETSLNEALAPVG